jgi:hypothetical protein
VCAAHTELGLYGNAAADAGVCAATLLAASTTGALRIVADAHYASDVFAGAALGLASGYLLPKFMWFGGFGSGTSKEAREHKPLSVAATVLPSPLPEGGMMVSVSGIVF